MKLTVKDEDALERTHPVFYSLPEQWEGWVSTLTELKPRQALEQGRDVFAIPGPITSTLSKGPIDLIKDGARAVFEPGEILDELGIFQVQSSKFKVQNSENLSEDEKKVLLVLENESLHIDEIGRRLNLTAAKISSLLLKMEISGLITNVGSGTYCKL